MATFFARDHFFELRFSSNRFVDIGVMLVIDQFLASIRGWKISASSFTVLPNSARQ
jgi:hypothetical protein